MEATRSRSSSSRRKSRPRFSSGAPCPRSRYFKEVCEGLKEKVEQYSGQNISSQILTLDSLSLDYLQISRRILFAQG